MAFVVCIVPVSPMRKEAAHRSEMVSQLLFGEVAEVLEESKSFTKLRTLFYLQKKSYHEIVDITGFSLLQVKSYIQNGKRNLKILVEKKMNKL